MKNKFLFAVAALLVIIASCNQNNDEQSAHANNSATDSSEQVCVNPNGDSELALLMRSMYSHLASVRQSALDSKLSGSYPVFIDSIYFAKPTDSTMVDSEFPARAKEYITVVTDLYKSNPEGQAQAFDVVVSKCESCHMHYCPGPLEKIRKLYIKK